MSTLWILRPLGHWQTEHDLHKPRSRDHLARECSAEASLTPDGGSDALRSFCMESSTITGQSDAIKPHQSAKGRAVAMYGASSGGSAQQCDVQSSEALSGG